MIVDTHCHASSRWYEPVDTLLFNMDRCGVGKAVLVQLLGSNDSSDMIAARNTHPDRFVYIGAIDPASPHCFRTIEATAAADSCGLRMRANWRSDGDDPLAIWRLVEKSGLRVSMAGTAASFTDGSLAEIAQACPTLHIVLEHLGGLARPDAGDRTAALPLLCALAAHPGISLKLTGLGQIAPRAPNLDTDVPPLDLTGVQPLLAALLAAFGAGRLMWGSDFPPVAAREGYANALDWTRALLAEHWPAAVEPCFGGNARRFFALDCA